MVVWAAALVVATVTSFRSFRAAGVICYPAFTASADVAPHRCACFIFFSLPLAFLRLSSLSLGDKLTVHVCGGVVLDRYNNGGWVERPEKNKNEAPCLQRVSVYHDAFIDDAPSFFFFFYH